MSLLERRLRNWFCSGTELLQRFKIGIVEWNRGRSFSTVRFVFIPADPFKVASSNREKSQSAATSSDVESWLTYDIHRSLQSLDFLLPAFLFSLSLSLSLSLSPLLLEKKGRNRRRRRRRRGGRGRKIRGWNVFVTNGFLNLSGSQREWISLR